MDAGRAAAESAAASRGASRGGLVGTFLEQFLLERALFATDCGIIITDAVPGRNHILFANPGFERLSGYPLLEVLGRNCRFLQGPDTDPAQVAGIRDALRDAREHRTILKNYRRDGTPFWNELVVSPVRDEAGNLTHFVGVQLDVTGRRIAEEEAERARVLAENVVETVRQPLLVLDRALRVVAVNRAFRETFRVAEEETVGRLLYRLGGGPWDVPDLRQRLEEVLPRDRAFSDFELTGDFPGIGRRTLLLNARVMESLPGSPAVLLAIEDVTDRRAAEEASALVQRERLAAAERQRAFLREVLKGVTAGRLLLVEPEQLPGRLPGCGEPIDLPDEVSVRAVRAAVRAAARDCGFAREREQDLETAAGEAAMNALLHGGAGAGASARVCACDASAGGSTVQVWVSDRGGGIAMESLHRATLERGFTTRGSLGHGFWLMLKTCDRLYLATGKGGTTVVLEQDRVPPAPEWI